MIIGTAGHIDHGKTSLVRAMTGVDTDSLKEEKARGITIELGFAYLPRPSGTTLGFIDVPGHERLVHTMLAGASGIDYALLVVAADDGVMPQTREHLAIIDLLGIRHGAVALTKCDSVSLERIDVVRLEIRHALADSALADVAILPVSAITGAGIAELLAHLDQASHAVTARAAGGRFRLAIDRVFTLAGTGTIVTGTALSGKVAVGDRIVVSPAGVEARVRSLHAQNATAEVACAGQRCALALTGPAVSLETITRGSVALDPSLHEPVRRIDARVRLLASEKKALTAWMPVKVHHAASEFDGRVLPLEENSIGPAESGFVQIALDRPAAMAVGDTFVLRDTSASRTIAGGAILDLHPPERHRRSMQRRRELEIFASLEPAQALRQLLEAGRGFTDIDVWFKDRAMAATCADDAIDDLDLVVLARQGVRIVMHREGWKAFTADAVARLSSFHQEKPDLPGIGQERLRNLLSPRLPAPAFAIALGLMQKAGVVAVDRSWVRLPGHIVRLTEDEERLWTNIKSLLGGAARFRPPRVRDVAKLQRIDEAYIRRIFKLAARRGDADEVAQDHFFLSDTMIELADIARALAAQSPTNEFAVIDFRDKLDNGRKVAIQILEFFDRQGLTMRRGDIRRINPHKMELFSRAVVQHPSQDQAPSAVGGEAPPVGRPDFKSGEGRETALGGFDSCLLRQPSSGARR